MSYSISNLKQDLEGILNGTTTNEITNLNGLIYRAARELLLDIDPQETIRIVEFTAPLFNSVVDYPIASDVKGNRIIDIRPQVNRFTRDIWGQAYNQAFDVAKQNAFCLANMFTVNFNTGIKTLRINCPFLPPPIVINYANETNANGTWSVGGGASNLTVNNQNYVVVAGALNFNLPSGAGYVENTTMTSLNLTNELNQGSIFLYVYMPTGSQFTSVNLRWGSSSTNYYSVTATTTQQNTAFQNGWNLLQFPWLGASVTGTPDVTNITYARVTYNTTAIQTAAGLNDMTVILGNVLEYEYYSKFLFRDAITGAFQETVTSDSNLINLDTESYNLLFNLVASLAVQQQQGMDALYYNGSFFAQKYQQGIERYKDLYKSQAQKPQSTYYAKPNPSNGRYYNRRW